MKLFNSKKKVVLSAVAVLFISVAAFAGSTNPDDGGNIMDRMFGMTCEIAGYGFNCCKHTFWFEHGCKFSKTDLIQYFKNGWQNCYP